MKIQVADKNSTKINLNKISKKLSKSAKKRAKEREKARLKKQKEKEKTRLIKQKEKAKERLIKQKEKENAKQTKLREQGRDLAYNAVVYERYKKRAKDFADYLRIDGFELSNEYQRAFNEPEKTSVTLSELNSAKAFFSRVSMKRDARRVYHEWWKSTTINGVSMVRSSTAYNQNVNARAGESYADFERWSKQDPNSNKGYADMVQRLKDNVEENHTVSNDILKMYHDLVMAQLGHEPKPGEVTDSVKIPTDYDPTSDDLATEYQKLWDNHTIKRLNITNPDVRQKLNHILKHPYMNEDMYSVYMQHRTKNNDLLESALDENNLDDEVEGDRQSIYDKIQEVMNTSYAWNCAKKGGRDSDQAGIEPTYQDNWFTIGENLFKAYATRDQVFIDDLLRDLKDEKTSAEQIAKKVDAYMSKKNKP